MREGERERDGLASEKVGGCVGIKREWRMNLA